MMVEIRMKVDPLRPGWYLPDEGKSPLPAGSRSRFISPHHFWRPPTDVYETEESLVVRVEIAGMHEKNFSLSLSEKCLVIRGLRPDIPERRAYHQMEIPFGEFETEVNLPCQVAIDQVTAEYTLGFLRVVLPRETPHRIKVKG
jgi:HSP20 family protein